MFLQQRPRILKLDWQDQTLRKYSTLGPDSLSFFLSSCSGPLLGKCVKLLSRQGALGFSLSKVLSASLFTQVGGYLQGAPMPKSDMISKYHQTILTLTFFLLWTPIYRISLMGFLLYLWTFFLHLFIIYTSLMQVFILIGFHFYNNIYILFYSFMYIFYALGLNLSVLALSPLGYLACYSRPKSLGFSLPVH